MKNIVLVTWKGGGNFGTCLQCFALYKKIHSLGYHVSLLQSKPPKYTFKLQTKGLLAELGLLSIVNRIKKFFIYPPKPLQEEKRTLFQESVYNTITLYSYKQEKELVASTDCFITGSDQIWNTYYCFNPFFFLSFAKETKRIAYASSIGTNSIKKEHEEIVKKLLLKFKHIGVRENEAVKVLSDLTGRSDIIQVLDPTFLLSPEEWSKMAEKAVYEMQLPQDFILCYVIGQNEWYKDQLQEVSNKLGIKNVIILPATENKDFTTDGAIVYNNASPVEFVDLLQRAKYVCTDSFHATALCINNSVPFVEFMRFKDDDKLSQNSRIYNVLTHYDLMNRIYSADSLEWIKPINYPKVQEILTVDRQKSIDYLINAIKN